MLNGGADDDILALLDPAFLEGFGTGGGRMLGGTGSDTLRLDGTGVSLDLGAIPDTRHPGDRAASTALARARRMTEPGGGERFRAGVLAQSEVF